MKLTIAIDPGDSGGIAWHDGRPHVKPMPATDMDVRDLIRSILQGAAMSSGVEVCHIEKVGGFIGGAGSPGSAMFGFGFGAGFIHGVLAAYEVPVLEVTPQRWQKVLGLGSHLFEGTATRHPGPGRPAQGGLEEQAQGRGAAALSGTERHIENIGRAADSGGRHEGSMTMTNVELKLRAENETEDRIMDYLLENASEALIEKINAGKKTLAGALRYCKDKAQKQSHNGVACIEDATVFGWVIHYFEESELDEEEKPKATAPAATSPAQSKPARRPRTPRKEKPEAEAPAPAPAPAAPKAEDPAPAPENPPPQPAAQPDLFTEKGGQ